MTESVEPKPDAEELIEQGQGLVRSLALRIARSIPVPVDLDDLISYGQVGLAQAARDFDGQRGSQFTTFAYHRVRGAIFDGVSEMSWVSRARYQRIRYQQLAAESLRQSQEESGAASTTLADDAAWFQQTAEKLAVIYLSTLEGAGGSGESLVEDKAQPPSAGMVAKEIGERLHELVDRLSDQEARLIRAIYFEGYSLQDAAARTGISKSWASRIHARSLEQLARWLRQIGAD